jgi:hypothetical protein
LVAINTPLLWGSIASDERARARVTEYGEYAVIRPNAC